MNIKTKFVYPPIPTRDFDWSAVDDDTYDGEGCPIGRGESEEEAIADLLEQIGWGDQGIADVPADPLSATILDIARTGA